MRLRKLALAVGLASALGAEMASALGLGEIKLNSTLNQPLDAEIRLLQVRDLTPDEILVALATREDFSRAGVDRPFFLTDLKFIVKLDGPNGPMVRVTTRKPVREPYLNFLLETQWPNGRLLREYTLLMDLPVFSEDRAASVTRAQSPQPSARQTQRQAAQPTARPQASTQSQTEASPVETQPSRTEQAASTRGYGSAGDVYGPVSGSDTLWEIALKARPSRKFSVQQTMLAIQRMNPEAFINGNINLLRKGQVLRLPKADQIAGLNSRQAVNEVAYQNTQWSGDPNGKTSGPQLEAGKRLAEKTKTRDGVEGRLKLASGGADGAESGRADGAEGGDTDALQNELAISLEELDRSQRENSELKERVNELEDQISTMERLVEVSNEQLRALQLASKQGADQVQDTAVGSDVADTATPAVEEPVAKAPAAETAKPAPKKVVKPAPKPSEPSMLDTLLDNILLIGAGLLAIVGALVVFLRRRGESEEEQQDEGLARLPDEDDFESPFAEADEQEEDLPLDTDDELSAEDSLVFDEPEESSDALLGGELDTELDFDDAGVSGEAETDDAVGEADIYIAYGKLDQAEDMLVKAIDADPANIAARLKLMEVYVEANNLAAFDQQYGQVVGDASAKDRADELRTQFADAPAFDAGSALEADSASDVAVSDDGFGELDLTEEFQTEPETDDDLTLDFDDAELGLDDLSLDTDADLVPEGEGAVGDAEEDETVDFSFDDLDLDGEDTASESSFIEDEATEVESDDALGELSLDLDLTDLDAEDEVMDLDFDLGDLEAGEDSTAEDITGEATDFDSDLSLDLDGVSESFELDVSELDASGVESAEEAPTLAEADDDLSIDFDLGDISADDGDADTAADDSFELDLDFESAEPSTGPSEESVAADDGLSLDLSDDLELSADDSLGDLTFEEPAAEAEPAVDTAAEFDTADDFDLADLDADMDLAALDQEVDALAGNLDMASEEFGDEAEEPLLELSEPEAEAPVMDEPLSDFGELDLALDSEEPSADLSEEPLADLGEESLAGLNEEPLADLNEEPLADFSEEPLELSMEETPTMEEPLTDDLMSFDLDEPVVDVAPEASPEDSLTEASVAEEPVTEEEPEFDIAADLGIDLDAEPEQASEEDVFDAALSDIPSSTAEDLALGDEVMDEDLDAELDFLADTDEAATKLDLARAYIDMGDKDGAKDILSEVVAEGNADQQKDAEELLSRIN